MSSQRILRNYLDLSWHYAVEPSEWEGERGYWACVSELPNCSTFAPTQSEALSRVAELLPAYLEAALKSGAEIPLPDSRDPDADQAGGTIVLRLPRSLHVGLKNAARREHTSLNQFALYALTKAVCQTVVPGPSVGSKTSAGSTKQMREARKKEPLKRKKDPA